MISEGNIGLMAAEKSSLCTFKKKVKYRIVVIFHNIAVLSFFYQINAALVNIRHFLQKGKKIALTPNFWTIEHIYLSYIIGYVFTQES